MASVSAHARRRTGCLECRRRKQQCDEGKPSCLCCQRRKVLCSYHKPELVTGSRFNVKVAGAHVFLPLQNTGSSQSATFINVESNDFKLLCPQYAIEQVSGEALARNNQNKMSIPPSLSPWKAPMEEASFCDVETENQFIQYYLEVISNSRAYVPSESNMFLHAVVRALVFGEDSVRAIILAMSAMEWSSGSAAGTNQYAAAADYYKVKALQKLQRSLSNELLAEETLMACILLTSMDISLGSQPTWLQHVRGALAVLDASADRLSPMSTAFALRYTQFRYILMSTTRSKRHQSLNNTEPLGSGAEARDEVLTKLAAAKMATGTIARQLVDPLLGCSIEMLDYICQISMLDDAIVGSMECCSSAQVRQAGRVLEKKIRNLPASIMSDIDGYLRDSAECFRSASLIYLQMVVFRASIIGTKVPELLASLLGQLHAVINRNTPRRSFPMWPLFIAGVASVEERSRKEVLGLFDIIKMRWPVSNISRVLQALQAIWQTRDLQHDPSNVEPDDWQKTIKRFGWKLSLS